MHCVLIRDMGMTLGEILDLEELAADCAADGVWEFFFCAPAVEGHESGWFPDQSPRHQVAAGAGSKRSISGNLGAWRRQAKHRLPV